MSDEENVKKRNDVKATALEQTAQKRAAVDEVKQRSITSTKKINESRRGKKGAMSFDEEELAALKNNRTAALTANLSLESTDGINTKLAVPAVKKISDEVSESAEDDVKNSDWSNGGEAEPSTSSKPNVAKVYMKGKDAAKIFDAHEKPDALDPKEKSINRKADLKNNKKEDTNLIFDALEKPKIVDPKEELGLAVAKIRTRMSREARGVTSLTSIRPVGLRPVRMSESLKIKKFPVMPRLPFAKLRREISLRRSRESYAKGESKKSERSLKFDRTASSRSSSLELETPPSEVETKHRKAVPPTLPMSQLVRSEVAAVAAGSSKAEAPKKTEQSQRKDGLQKFITTEVVECPSQTLSGKELKIVEASSSQTITSKKSQSFSTIMDEPPRTHYKFVNIKVNLSQKQLDVNLSENLVIIFIQITSPLFYHLVVGDQITEVDGIVPNDLREFFNMVESATGEVTLGVVRPWNVRPPTPKRMAPVFALKKHCYLIVELPLIKKMRAGYEFQSSRGRLHFTKVEPQTMGAFAFLVVDRIIDVDSDLIPNQVNMVALKNRIRAVQERDGCCTFLVERPSSLHHISNPSCVAMKAPETSNDVEMADDAVEIGAREAFKHTFAKDKHRNTPVYGPSPKHDATTENEQLVTAVGSDTSALRLPRRRKKRTLKIGKNPKEKAIPSDVKQGTYLSKTSETSLRKLVTKFISKTFTR